MRGEKVNKEERETERKNKEYPDCARGKKKTGGLFDFALFFSTAGRLPRTTGASHPFLELT